MEIIALSTRLLLPPQDDALTAITTALDQAGGLHNGDILAITSKVVSLHQGRVIPIDQVPDKDQLIINQADSYLPRQLVPHNYAVLTIHNHLIAPSAGIDESNAQEYYVLLPDNPEQLAKDWRQQLIRHYKLQQLGLIITDSRSMPLRYGVVGVGLAFAGFQPLRDYRGQPDLFGRPMKISQTNIVDSLAAAAVYAMGECAEQTPIAIIRDIAGVQFTGRDCANQLWLNTEDDIYQPLYQNFLPGGRS
ncbi:MAG TPA: coenzyme F420-0:L-glutamate ligase [bacterium]|jgi:F420-0:gamma-glutamyl ligase|nr:coenzyme F420-0:L-glutamate ligase [bacterium]HNZ51495.1 coenzyme F420-0:L-glutamate ligase [bacterium]HOF79425.1 coenzyme F420-0:L-glutamate ligase [bacterium]HOH85304.1 coenzyme F420-0:L-glutamate ligase [bacterium]HOQ91885.1 coenzyme F420-0:L-glutamate ligase [bacterium]